MLDIEEGTDVRVYWNLHKKCYSVQTKQEKGWRVLGHCDNLQLNEPRFKVSKKGNQRVRDTGTKNVHAYVTGHWTAGWNSHFGTNKGNPYPTDWQPVRYNPYRYTDFMSGDDHDHRTPIHQARYATLDAHGEMWAAT